jgi:hypothetical protein
MNVTAEDLAVAVQADDRLISVADAREYFGGCIPGWEAFSETHGFDWKITMRHGIRASELLATEDGMALSLITYVYLREDLL